MTMTVRTGAVAFVLGTLFAIGAAWADRSVQVVNLTRTAIIGLQVRPAGGTMWVIDALAKTRRTLGIQKVLVISLPGGGCAYDFRLLFEDGHSAIKRRVDACRTPQIKLTEY